MSDSNGLDLEQKIAQLTQDLNDRERDLEVYQSEIERLNGAVSELLMGLDRDLGVLRNIFRFLIPTQFPHISGFNFSTKFVPGMRFNGDYIDIFEHRDRFKFNLIMSSSSGSALTALLIAFLLRHGRDLDRGGAPSPEVFVKKVLEEIEAKELSLADIQLSCFLVDKRTYSMSYSAHGQIHAFFQEGVSGKVKDLCENGQGEISLQAQDRLVVISPGLVGCPSESGAPFSLTPVLESLAQVPRTQSVHDLRNDIFFRLDQHLGDRRPLHDLSIIVMSVDDNIIKLV